MIKPTQRNNSELLSAYRDYLLSRVSKVRIIGEICERELKDVFVNLSLVRQPEPQQQAEYLGMIDSAIRERLNPFADAYYHLPDREKDTKRCVKPDEVLRHRTRAIVTGPPGCGKTTLLKYLALQSQEEEERLTVWLELKAIDKALLAQAENTAARSGNLILQELWLKHLEIQMLLTKTDINLLREHWQEKFKANEITILLDGFDELQDETLERCLNKGIVDFTSCVQTNTLLISTRPYAQHKLGKERLQELEIEPLNRQQIEAFLNCYYPNDPAAKGLLKTLGERSSLSDLLHIPLLLGVILRLYRESKFTGERLKIYETIITDLARELDRSKSVIRRFKINDERLRLDFLKFISFERLLRDPPEDKEQRTNWIVFSYDLLKEKAEKFLAQERSSHYPRDLADDVLSTPLLREVSTNMFTFAHLTLQEYLAACAFTAFYKSNEFEALKIFCRAYHNQTIVEMEVLPMMFGMVVDADKLYEELEQLPESLTLANYRLRARGMSYGTKITPQRRNLMVNRYFALITSANQARHANILHKCFWGVVEAEGALLQALRSEFPLVRALAVNALYKIGTEKSVDELADFLRSDESYLVEKVARTLCRIGTERAITHLLEGLKHSNRNVRLAIANALLPSQISTECVIDGLTEALEDVDEEVRESAVCALNKIRSERSAIGLLDAFLNNADHNVASWAAAALINLGADPIFNGILNLLKSRDRAVRIWAAYTLCRVDSERVIDGLLEVLKMRDKNLRGLAIVRLSEIDGESTIDILLESLRDKAHEIRSLAAEKLGEIGHEQAVEGLLGVLKDKDTQVRLRAAFALGKIGSQHAVDSLLEASNDKDIRVRLVAVLALVRLGKKPNLDTLLEGLKEKRNDIRQYSIMALRCMGSEQAVDSLLGALEDKHAEIRASAAMALGDIGSEQSIDRLVKALKDEDSYVRVWAAYALGRIGSKRIIEDLLGTLDDEDDDVYLWTAKALTEFSREILEEQLMNALTSESASVRYRAVQLIGYYAGNPQALDKLFSLAQHDSDSTVRDAAKKAAKRYARKLDLLGTFIADSRTQPLGDNESRELFLVGETFKVVAEAGHIFRPTSNSDWGIDGEIEFKNNRGAASGQRVYLQLKSGDSYLRKRKRDGKEIFTLKSRHAEYWQSHAYPVLLVVRNGTGQIRWMDVTHYLRRHGIRIKQIEFQGEPFTAESVKQMRGRYAR